MQSGVNHLDINHRVLSWREFGAADGAPLLFFHGYPATSLVASYIHETAAQRGLRLIAPDRPGMGDSSMSPTRRIVDWPKDVSLLAEHLGLETFDVLAFGAGAPYAWVCGAHLGDRVHRIGVVSGSVPAENHVWATAKAMKVLFTLPLHARVIRNPEQVERQWMRRISEHGECEAAAAGNDVFRRITLDSMREAFLEGSGGAAKDYALVTGANWGFALGTIGAESFVWHGDADEVVPVADVRRLTARVPHCTVEVLPCEGHYSAWVNHHEAILDTMARKA